MENLYAQGLAIRICRFVRWLEIHTLMHVHVIGLPDSNNKIKRDRLLIYVYVHKSVRASAFHCLE
jgi:hypothetical protein